MRDCPERERLASDYDRLVGRLEKLVEASTARSGDAMQRAKAVIESQRNRCIIARRELERHIQEHGC